MRSEHSIFNNNIQTQMVKVELIDETTFVTDFVVEAIVDKKVEKGKNFYLIKWAGWKNEHNTWEPVDNLFNFTEEIKLFDQKNKRIGKKIKKTPIVVQFQDRGKDVKKLVQAYKKERRLIIRRQNIVKTYFEQRERELNQTKKVARKRKPCLSRAQKTKMYRQLKAKRLIVQNPMEAEKPVEVFKPAEMEVEQQLETQQPIEIQKPVEANNPFDKIRTFVNQCEKMLKKGEVVRVNQALFRIEILDENNEVQKNRLVGVKAGQENNGIFMEFANKLLTSKKVNE